MAELELLYFWGAWGPNFKAVVLDLASLLKGDGVPGWVSLGFITALLLFTIILWWQDRTKITNIKMLNKIISKTKDEHQFAQDYEKLNAEIIQARGGKKLEALKTAWAEYRETFLDDRQSSSGVIRNSVRPQVFFNVEDLNFGPGIFRILPSQFVTVGLFFTFLGLVAALQTLGGDAVNQQAMGELLNVASAKFIMSLTGLACSILFTFALRIFSSRVGGALHDLNTTIERRLSFVSLEDLTMMQIQTAREQTENLRAVGTEMVAELGRPLREELPATIAESISGAMSPLLQQVNQMSSDGVGNMVSDLSSKFSEDVGQALANASAQLDQASARIANLVDRMDSSSGRMGTEMEGAIERLGQALVDLQGTMTHGAENASGAFAKGTEQMLAAMNETLSVIRENTGKSAEAIKTAAAELKEAAGAMRMEMQTAAHEGSAAAKAHLQGTATEVSSAIEDTGQSITTAFGETAQKIVQLTEDLKDKTSQELLGPLGQMATQISTMQEAVEGSITSIRHVADGLRTTSDASTQAATSFNGAAKSLTEAALPIKTTVERLEGSTRSLETSTTNVANTVAQSAKTIAESAQEALTNAEAILGSQRHAIETTFTGLNQTLEMMRGQGDRLDELDGKLGAAFETYRDQVESALEVVNDHVRTLQEDLTPALATMHSVVQQAENFFPESRRA